MGFGCNACGVTGCRIIDSPRERLIAILTNSFAPCNGRFPLLIFLCAVFFDAGSAGGALLLTGVIAGSVLLTLAASRLLSAFFLRGLPSSFVLELPPYRAPQPGRVIVRSVLDRTVFVLGRAMIVAAPAGALIWLLANITVSGSSLYGSMTAFLDPFGRFFGLDGVILAAFLLGFPANELVMPLIVLGYLSGGTLADVSDLLSFRALLLANGWARLHRTLHTPVHHLPLAVLNDLPYSFQGDPLGAIYACRHRAPDLLRACALRTRPAALCAAVKRHPPSSKKMFGGCFTLFQFKRTGIKLIVFAVLCDKLLVIAALDDMAELEHHDNICILHGGQAMRDNEHRSAVHQTIHAGLNDRLGTGV